MLHNTAPAGAPHPAAQAAAKTDSRTSRKALLKVQPTWPWTCSRLRRPSQSGRRRRWAWAARCGGAWEARKGVPVSMVACSRAGWTHAVPGAEAGPHNDSNLAQTAMPPVERYPVNRSTGQLNATPVNRTAALTGPCPGSRPTRTQGPPRQTSAPPRSCAAPSAQCAAGGEGWEQERAEHVSMRVLQNGGMRDGDTISHAAHGSGLCTTARSHTNQAHTNRTW